MASIVIHTTVIGGAIVATASARTERPTTDKVLDETPIFIPMPDADAARRTAGVPRESGRRRHEPVDEVVALDRPSIVYSPSPVAAPAADVDPRELLGRDTIALGLPHGPTGGDVVGRVTGEQPATAATVDRPAALVALPRPRYPDQLRAAGVAGRVVVRLVVDTTGRVEPASVVFQESSHDLFTRAVRAVLPFLRFSPAEEGGRRVRMLVDLPFEFRLHE
jgi:protein TonB